MLFTQNPVVKFVKLTFRLPGPGGSKPCPSRPASGLSLHSAERIFGQKILRTYMSSFRSTSTLHAPMESTLQRGEHSTHSAISNANKYTNTVQRPSGSSPALPHPHHSPEGLDVAQHLRHFAHLSGEARVILQLRNVSEQARKVHTCLHCEQPTRNLRDRDDLRCHIET